MKYEAFRETLNARQRGDLYTVRAVEDDARALTIFDLPGTSTSPFPVGLIAALDVTDARLRERLLSCAKSLIDGSACFHHVSLAGAVIRVFENGHASMIVIVDFAASPNSTSDEFVEEVAVRFDRESPELNEAREIIKYIMHEAIELVLIDSVTSCLGPSMKYDGTVRFISTFYSMAGTWALNCSNPQLERRLWNVIQPEPRDDFLSQSPRTDEVVIFTSGYHIYVHRQLQADVHDARLIALVSFLVLLNMLYLEMETIKDTAIKMVASKRAPLFLPSYLDEQLEILYSQIMVSSVSWRRDISSFADEVNRRWRIRELKDYCLFLIQALEAQSERRRAVLLTIFVTLLTFAQIISIVADGWQIVDKLSASSPP